MLNPRIWVADSTWLSSQLRAMFPTVTRRFFPRTLEHSAARADATLLADLPQILHRLTKVWLAAELASRVARTRLTESRNGTMPRAHTPIVESCFAGAADSNCEFHREICSRQHGYKRKGRENLFATNAP